MSVLRWVTVSAVTALGCSAALAGPASARISGTGGPLIAFERAGDIRVLSAVDSTGASVNITNSPGVVDRAPSWGLPDQRCVATGNGSEFAPPNGRTLVFESRPSGDADIVLAKLQGNPPVLASSVNLTAASDADEGAPQVGFALDAANVEYHSIVFTRGPVGRRDLWAMRLDGSSATQLTTAPADDSSPDWSGDGKSVIYQTAGAGGQQLAIIDVSFDPAQQRFVIGGTPRLVTASPAQHGDPSWWTGRLARPDPSRIVHVATASGATYLDVLEQEPTTLTAGALFAPASAPAPLRRQLTGDPGGDLAPSWRPEGDHITFESDRGQAGNRDIYRVRLDGANLVRLTQDPAADRAPDWEPYSNFFCLDPLPYTPRPGTQTRSGPPLRVTGQLATKAGTGNRRTVIVRFIVNRAASGSLILRRSGRNVARKLNVPLAPGAREIRVNVPRRAPGGSHSLRLTVTAGPAVREFTTTIKIRSLRSR